MRQKLTNLAHKFKIPGLSVAIGSQNNVVTEAIGITNKKKPEQITPDTIFEVASLSKPVFAYIVLKMVEQGKLSLDQPLYEIFPEFGPEKLRKHPYNKLLTPQLILPHQAGLSNWSPEEYITKPGERFDYSGLAYCFLNDVIEKVSGKKLEELAQEIFSELGMNNSSFLPFKEGKLKAKTRAMGHNSNEKPDENEHFRSANPAASLLTTAKDYAKFLLKCANDDFIKKYMFTPFIELSGNDKKAIDLGVPNEILQQLKWGLGFGLHVTPSGEMIAFHWGDSETNRSLACINLETKEVAVCLTNSANGPKIFNQVMPSSLGNLNPLFFWLSKREGLPINIKPKKYSWLLENIGFLSKKQNTEQPNQTNSQLKIFNS